MVLNTQPAFTRGSLNFFLNSEVDTSSIDALGMICDYLDVFEPSYFSYKNEVPFNVFLEMSVDIDVRFDKDSLMIKYVGDIVSYIPQIILLLNQLLTIRRESSSIYTVHGVAVSNGQEALIIYGPQKSGKTTLALAMQKKFGWKFVSTDYCLLEEGKGGFNLAGGTSGIAVRGGSISGDLDAMSVHKLDQSIAMEVESIPIKSLIMLSSWPSKAYAKETKDAVMGLFNHICQRVRLSIVFNEKVISMPIDTQELTDNRWEFVQRMSGALDILEISGDTDSIAELLDKKYSV